jgi:hypothetical protein
MTMPAFYAPNIDGFDDVCATAIAVRREWLEHDWCRPQAKARDYVAGLAGDQSAICHQRRYAFHEAGHAVMMAFFGWGLHLARIGEQPLVSSWGLPRRESDSDSSGVADPSAALKVLYSRQDAIRGALRSLRVEEQVVMVHLAGKIGEGIGNGAIIGHSPAEMAAHLNKAKFCGACDECVIAGVLVLARDIRNDEMASRSHKGDDDAPRIVTAMLEKAGIVDVEARTAELVTRWSGYGRRAVELFDRNEFRGQLYAVANALMRQGVLEQADLESLIDGEALRNNLSAPIQLGSRGRAI